MSVVKKIVKKATKTVSKITDNKLVQIGIGAYFGGYGGALYGAIRGKKDAKGVYNLYTGHYARQQSRLAKDEQRQQQKIIAQQKEYEYNQRKEQIDALRERVGAGGSRYRTNRQDRKTASSFLGSSNNVETLG